jgi:plasmid maintenance system antidote protein VapI
MPRTAKIRIRTHPHQGAPRCTADTALRLSRDFGTTPEFWMNLQAHDLSRALSSHTYEEIPIRSGA